MSGKVCQICGKPSGMYPLYKDCMKKKELGLVVKNEKTGKWEEVKKEDKSTDSVKLTVEHVKKTEKGANSVKGKCIICGNTATYDLCFSCFNKKNIIKEELAGSVDTLNDAKDYYNNLKYNIYKLKDMDYAQTACLKLLALGEILQDQYHLSGYASKAKKEALDLLTKKEAYLNSKNKFNNSEEEKNAKNSEEEPVTAPVFSDRDAIVEEKAEDSNDILDFRRVYPMSFRCKDGHYVRSKSEKFIDNSLFEHRIIHVYEKRVVDNEKDKNYYPDFYLPYQGRKDGENKGIYLEYFGREDDEKYMAKEKRKLDFYQTQDFDVIEARERNISNIDEFLEDEIRKINKKYNNV